MPAFEHQFVQSNGGPISYNGATLVLLDRFAIRPGGTLRLTFESSAGPWRQGVLLRTDGSFTINDQVLKKSVLLWRDTAPEEVLFRVNSKKGSLEVNNVWDMGDGAVHYWHNGAAMIVDEIPTGRRYRCNDGHPDDNFTDLIFRLEHGAQ